MLGLQEKAKCCGYRIPQYFWFMLSGFLCDCSQALIDYVLYSMYIWDWEKTTVCWAVSYSISIFIRHFSHKMIVFGDYEGTYCQSLSRTYLTYSSSIVISTLANHMLVSYAGLSHYQAWLSTMCWIGIYNYILLRANWGNKNKDGQVSSSSSLGNLSGADPAEHIELLDKSNSA